MLESGTEDNGTIWRSDNLHRVGNVVEYSADDVIDIKQPTVIPSTLSTPEHINYWTCGCLRQLKHTLISIYNRIR